MKRKALEERSEKGAVLSGDEIDELRLEDEMCILKHYARKPNIFPPIITRAERCYIWDANGNRYMDFSSQYGNVNIGHGHLKVIEAIKKQAEELTYAAPSWSAIPTIKLAKKLKEITPNELDRSLFVNSGAAAVESAIKTAKEYTGRFKIISLWRAYHGTTYGAMSAMGIPILTSPYEPLVPGFIHVPPPYCYRCSFGLEYPNCDLQCARFVERTIQWEDPQRVAAFIAEPILGGGGTIPPPKEYWPIIREICDKFEILMITDEIITGFGRIGKMFACEYFNVTPDILVLGKGITSGYLPLAAIVVRNKISEFFEEKPSSLGFTYLGHPLCCSAALACINVYLEEKLVENAAKLGPYLIGRLMDIEKRHEIVGDVRGLGFMTTIELVDKKTKEPLIDDSFYTSEKALEMGLYTAATDWAPGTLRLYPPLCITKEEIDEATNILDEALDCTEKKIE